MLNQALAWLLAIIPGRPHRLSLQHPGIRRLVSYSFLSPIGLRVLLFLAGCVCTYLQIGEGEQIKDNHGGWSVALT